MFNQLTTTEKIAVAASSVVLAALALVISLNLTIAPSYPDFIVGNLAWSAGTKLQDLIAAPIFIAVFFLSFISFSFLLVKKKRLPAQKQSAANKYRNEIFHQLILWSLPAIAAIISLISSRILLGTTTIDTNFLLISAAGIGFIMLATAYNSVKKIDVSPKILSLYAFAILLIALLPLELALVLGRLPLSLVGEINLAHFVKATYVLAVFGLAVGLFYFIWNQKTLSRLLPILLLVGQAGLCIIFLTLYPARLLQPDGVLIEYETTVWLKILVIGAILSGLYDVIRRYKKHSATTDWAKLLSPIALFALLVGLRAGNTVMPHISPDDYHFGEGLLGWWSYIYHGAIPYVGFVPPHGLIGNYMAQLMSFFFYDGSAGSLAEASRLSFAILAFASFISIYKFSSSIGLAFVSTFFLFGLAFMSPFFWGGIFAWFFLTPFLCLWCSRALQENPSRWLSTWLLTAPIVILGVPPQGLLLVTASGVMAAYSAWRLWRNPEARTWTGIGLSLATLIILGLATPLGSMFLGAIRYVFENGPLNQVAYGIPWSLSWNVGAPAILFEMIRMSWVAIPIGCLAIIYTIVKDSAMRKYTLLPAVVVLLFVLLLIPYSMGRIDPGAISRPGLVAIFGWAVLLPIVAWGIVHPKNKVLVILLVACMGAALNFFAPISSSNLVSSMSSKINTPLLRDGQSAGMSNIGIAYVQDEHWDRLTRLSALLDPKLAPGESYLDLTSRNAQYFYFNRRPVIAITAPYNMVPLSQQKRAVEQLSQNLPRLALLEGDNIIHDGGGLALRTPYLYRFIVDNYIPQFEDGFIIGLAKTDLLNDHEPTVDVAIKDLTDVNWYRGVHRTEPAIIIADPALIMVIKTGDQVRFSNGEARRITRVWSEGSAVWFEGAAIEPVVAGHPIRVQLAVSPQRLAEYRASLFQRAFSQADLQKIPVAWGRSEESLEKRMTLVKSFNGIEPNLHQLIPEGGSYKVNGVDPYLSFDLTNLHLSGRGAGLLRFDFACVGKTVEPRIQVFWWGDKHQGPSEAFSVRFTAGNGSLIVPLDASPRWLTLKHIKGIRIDLDNASACSAFSIKNIELFQRRF